MDASNWNFTAKLHHFVLTYNETNKGFTFKHFGDGLGGGEGEGYAIDKERLRSSGHAVAVKTTLFFFFFAANLSERKCCSGGGDVIFA